jgi:hypothetical protein
VRGDDIFIFFIFLGVPYILGWIYRTSLNHKQFMKVVQLKADMNARLLDRLGSDPQALEFLKSDAQQHLFEVKAPEPRMPSAYSRMLTSVQLAAVLLSAGIGCLWFRGYLYEGSGDQTAFLFFGILGVSLGIGALVSAVSAYAVSRLWQNAQATEQGARF